MNSLTCQKVFIIRGGVCHNDSPLERIKNLFAFVQETSPQRDEKRGPVKPIQNDGKKFMAWKAVGLYQLALRTV